MAIRNLTDDEFLQAIVFCELLEKKQGIAEFTMNCIALAKNKQLTRGQFDRLKYAMKNPSIAKPRIARQKIVQGKSRKPITLPKI